MNTRLITILRLIEKKYPSDYRRGMNPVLFIYDDESGRILKNATESAYGGKDNTLFDFSTIAELVEHLKEK